MGEMEIEPWPPRSQASAQLLYHPTSPVLESGMTEELRLDFSAYLEAIMESWYRVPLGGNESNIL